MQLPKHLTPGDTIGIIAPAGPFKADRLQQALPFFRNMGLHVRLGRHIHKRHGYLAGNDSERLEDFHEMINDSDIQAIVFARGGYGIGRIAADIDYDAISRHPKIIWGYSDITYLHNAIQQKCGLVTFHGPMAASDIGKNDFHDLSAGMFKQLFFPTELIYTEHISELNVFRGGMASGELAGGNLSLMVQSIGTPFEIDTTDKLVLLEDIGELPYQVDGMLNQLKLSGKLSAAAGIIIGDFADSTPDDPSQSLALEEVFHDYFHDLDVPVVGGFKIGHCSPHFAVPLGANATLSASDKTLHIDPGVC